MTGNGVKLMVDFNIITVYYDCYFIRCQNELYTYFIAGNLAQFCSTALQKHAHAIYSDFFTAVKMTIFS